MTRIAVGVLLFALSVETGTAQDASREFPLGKPYRVVSVNGFDVQKAAMTLAVAPGQPGSNRLPGSGHAGCNEWTGKVILNDEQIDVSDVVTTKKFCGKPRMNTEEAFLTTLKAAHRWKVDGNKLIMEGDAGRLMLMAGAPDKTPDKKPAKNKR